MANYMVNVTKAGTYKLPTKNKFVDRDIDVEVAASSIGVADSKPEGYEENTTAVVPTQGYLKIEAGYMPKTIISLKTLVPDEATITHDAAGQATMLTGTSAYDKDGNLVVGTMKNLGSATKTLTDQGDSVTIEAGYTAGGTITVDIPEAVASVDITANTNNVVVGTMSDGFYELSNTMEIVDNIDEAGYAEVSSTKASKSVKVGKIKAGETIGATDDGIIPAGGDYTIKAGYYSEDITVTAEDSAGDLDREPITGSLTATAPEGYTAPSLADAVEVGKSYVTLTGSGSMTTGNIFNGTVNAAQKFLEIFDGTFNIVEP